MFSKEYFEKIRGLIGKNELEEAIVELSDLLQNSPKLDDAILQSSRWNDTKKQIRKGQINYEQANISKNQIRAGLLELLRDIEEKSNSPEINRELELSLTEVKLIHAIPKEVAEGGENVQTYIHHRVTIGNFDTYSQLFSVYFFVSPPLKTEQLLLRANVYYGVDLVGSSTVQLDIPTYVQYTFEDVQFWAVYHSSNYTANNHGMYRFEYLVSLNKGKRFFPIGQTYLCVTS